MNKKTSFIIGLLFLTIILITVNATNLEDVSKDLQKLVNAINNQKQNSSQSQEITTGLTITPTCSSNPCYPEKLQTLQIQYNGSQTGKVTKILIYALHNENEDKTKAKNIVLKEYGSKSLNDFDEIIQINKVSAYNTFVNDVEAQNAQNPNNLLKYFVVVKYNS